MLDKCCATELAVPLALAYFYILLLVSIRQFVHLCTSFSYRKSSIPYMVLCILLFFSLNLTIHLRNHSMLVHRHFVFTLIMAVLFILYYWGSKPRPRACQACTPPLSCSPRPVLWLLCKWPVWLDHVFFLQPSPSGHYLWSMALGEVPRSGIAG